jgi:serine/threonine protein kinase/tetratricopeptide (TPR) repeat protein
MLHSGATRCKIERVVGRVEGEVGSVNDAPLRLVASHVTPDVGPPADLGTLGDSDANAPGQAPVAPRRITPVGGKLGRYHVLDELGAGGMGVVYAAYDPELDRRVALKLLPPGAGGEEATARLIREAQSMARLSHPNVVHIYDVGRVDGSIYITMQLVEGGTLKQWMAGGRPWREVVPKFVAAARGLAAAHAAGIVHRDFKPDNVLMERDGSARVVDFGLARPIDQVADVRGGGERIGEAADAELLLEHPLTRTGALIGTPVYMAPEQHTCGETDDRTDQFSFCVALYEGLYGVRPFTGRTIAAIALEVTRGNVLPPPKDAKVPKWLHRIVLRGLASRPEDRWPSMLALIQALERPPWRVRPGFAALAGLVLLAAGGAAGFTGGSESAAPVCGGAPLKLSGVWDDAARDRVRSSFGSLGQAESGSRVEKRLDAYARRWSQQYRHVCEATNLRQEQSQSLLDLRMACLDRRLWELDGVVKVLESGDEAVLENADTAVAGLRPIEACATVDSDAGELEVLDGVMRERVDGLRRRLADAKALSDAGRLADGLAVAERVADRALELDHPPLRAEALLRLGILQRTLGDAAAAAETLREAAWLADEHRLEEVETLAKIELVSVEGLDLDRPERAREWGRHAQAAVQRFAPDGLPAAELAFGLGLTEHAAGNLSAAREHHFRALTVFERELGRGDPRIARSLARMGELELDAGMPRDAARYLDKALELYEQEGASPARLAPLAFWRARADWEMGDESPETLARAGRARLRLPDGAPEAAAMDEWLRAHASP